ASVFRYAVDATATPHPYLHDARPTFTVTVTETGITNGTASGSNTATVAEADLSVTGTAVSATEGSSFNGSVATFTDTNSSDPATAVEETSELHAGWPIASGPVMGSAG